MLKGTDSQLSPFQKFEVWFGRQAIKITLVCFAVVFLSLVLVLINNKSTAEREKKLLNILERTTKYAVTLTPDGRISTVEKTPISAAVLKKYVRAAVVNYFLLDREAFTNTNGMLIKANPQDKIKFLKTLIEQSPRIKNLTAFFNPKDRVSLNYLYIYLKYLYGLAKGGTLPDIIRANGQILDEKFTTRGSSFLYQANIGVTVSWVGVDGKWHATNSKIFLKISGYFNPLKGGELNPYGMKVKKFLSIQYVTI